MIIVNYSVSGSNPSVVNPPGTGIVYFPNAPSPTTWGIGSEVNVSGFPPMPSSYSSSGLNVNPGVSSNQTGVAPTLISNNGGLVVPGLNALNGQKFNVTACGDVAFGITDPSTTATISLQLSTALPTTVPPNWQTLATATITNQALDLVYYPWCISLDLQGSTQSGVLQITKSTWINGIFSGPTQVAALTGISFNPQANAVGGTVQQGAFTLAVGVQFGASSASNTANLYQFSLFAQ